MSCVSDRYVGEWRHTRYFSLQRKDVRVIIYVVKYLYKRRRMYEGTCFGGA